MVERKITLGNKTLNLKYPNSAVRKMDAELGVSSMNMLTEGFIKGESRLSRLDVIATIIWAGLLTDKPGTRVDDIVDLIPMDIKEYLGVVNDVSTIVANIFGITDIKANAEVLEEEHDLGNAPSQQTATAGAGNAQNA